MTSTELRVNAGKQLLFNRVFSLNNSHSKNVVIGLAQEGDGFVPTIRLVNQSWSGVTFIEKTWREFIANYHTIRKHFSKSIAKKDDISFDGKSLYVKSKKKLTVMFQQSFHYCVCVLFCFRHEN